MTVIENENTLKHKPGWITGALVGIMLTAPLIVVFYLGEQLAGLPFVPFDIFDWMGRVTPGAIITFVIDTMVDMLTALNFGDELSSTAKTAENLMGLSTTLGIGIVAGALLFFLLNRAKQANPYLFGGAMGAGIGVILILIFNRVNLTATADPTLSMAWIFLTFTIWGVAYGWIYSDLSAIGASKAEDASANAQQLDRRQFLVRLGGATATLTVLGAGLNLVLRGGEDTTTTATTIASLTEGSEIEGVIEPSPDTIGEEAGIPDDLPNAGDAVEPAPGTRPEYTPLDNHYRIDISSRPPIIDAASWTLAISGLVGNPKSYTLNELVEDYQPVDRFVTMQCISNRLGGSLISTTRWTGIKLQDLIEEWDIQPEATHLRISSADGFDEYLSLETIREDERIMIAYAWDGRPLKRKHGFPIRIHVPDLYGMKQPKWITDIEAVDSWEEGYWVRRGWSATAVINMTSVVDTVATDAIIEEDGEMFVPIGGIAFTGAKGVSKVEVQVDEGEWQEAELRTPLSDTSWYIWRYNWQFEEGNHTFRVRTFDADGGMQTGTERGTRPDGATGWHSIDRNVEAV
ncbi:MAG: molybdopterin-dependent oxidoreductase [Aggregatilineales bacterium]